MQDTNGQQDPQLWRFPGGGDHGVHRTGRDPQLENFLFEAVEQLKAAGQTYYRPKLAEKM